MGFSTFNWDNFNWPGARLSSGMGTPEFGHFDFGFIGLGQRFSDFRAHGKFLRKRVGSPHKYVAGGIPTIIPFFAGQKRVPIVWIFEIKL